MLRVERAARNEYAARRSDQRYIRYSELPKGGTIIFSSRAGAGLCDTIGRVCVSMRAFVGSFQRAFYRFEHI